MPNLRPGNLTDVPADETQFTGSLADTIEQELDALLALDGLPQLPSDPTDSEVRARRRFLIAIARGVVRHLHENPEAFVVTLSGGDHQVAINAEQL
ncbi:hypothetical protein [uncultured Salipiger sp.]|mgnify:CR=1 FL=1|uniref:hypothetical protein n=1 Tax=uncultured Salipiger sp. TaxID=499810 RepID=UPI002596988E|nr:hypothetical protein [uncultured Salipiger sp.]